jgi:hypothetical protein
MSLDLGFKFSYYFGLGLKYFQYFGLMFEFV